MSNFKIDNSMKMLKQTILILSLSLMAFGSVSCLKDTPLVDWDDIKFVIEMPYDRSSHSVASSNVKQGSTVNFDLMVNYAIDYASKIQGEVPVQIGVDESLVATYNASLAASAKKYVLLPASAYTLPTQAVLSASQSLWKQTLSINTSGLQPGEYYILPVRILSVPEGHTISGNFGHVYFRILMAAE